MGGTASQQKTVKDFAPKWCDHCNIKLDFNNAPNAEIRISFDPARWRLVIPRERLSRDTRESGDNESGLAG